MVAGHGQIAGQEHEVLRLDRLLPLSLDPGRMVTPPCRVALASLGSGEREVQVGDRPDIHGHESLPPRAKMELERRVKSAACGRNRAKSRMNGLVRFSWPMVVAGP